MQHHLVFHDFVVVCGFFSKLSFCKNSFRKTIRVSNSLDPGQDQHSVSPDMGTDCLQKLSADDKSLPAS